MSGLYAGRNIKKNRHRRSLKDKHVRQKAKGTAYKTRPIGIAPQATGIVTEKIAIEAKQPNSALRKAVVLQLLKTKKKVAATVPYDGGLNFIDINDTVHIEGLGKKGRSKGDVPGIKYAVTKVQNVSLHALYTGKKEKPAR